jgi:Glycosyltransferase family 92
VKGYLSACAIYKNEARYLAEWVEFHLLAGVEHLFLYNNNSTDDHREVLEPYVRAGVVTIRDWPEFPAQVAAYNHCLEANGADWRWMAFIDLDEFLFSPRIEPVPEVLRGYEHLPAVAALWIIFGTSGHRTPPPGPVIENYTWRRIWPRRPREWKPIVDPRRTVRALGPHVFRYAGPWRGPVPGFASLSDLRLNHYLTKSEEEIRRKLERPIVSTGRPRGFGLRQMLKTHPGQVDEAILPYAPELRSALDARGIRPEDGRPALRAV